MTKIKDFHKELLILLKGLDGICTKHNIKYSLFAGTLIGAIRHKGFIPWDDDADIILERNEYEKLIKVLPPDFLIFSDLWVPRFRHKDNPKVFIDIFVFDATSNSSVFQNLQVLGLKAIQGTIKNNITTNRGSFGTFVSYCTYFIGLPLNENFKLKLYNKLAASYNGKQTKYVFSSLDQYKYIGNILPKHVLKSYKKIDFEDIQLMIMSGFDEYLRQFYGNYMELPPEESRKPEHGKVL